MFVCLRFSWKLIHVKDIRCVCMRQFFSCNQTRQAHQYCNWIVSHLQYNVTMNNNNNARSHTRLLVCTYFTWDADYKQTHTFVHYFGATLGCIEMYENRSCMRLFAFVFVWTCLRICKCVYECVFTNVMIRIVSLVPFLFDFILFPIVLSLPYDFTICLQAREKERHTKTKIYM